MKKTLFFLGFMMYGIITSQASDIRFQARRPSLVDVPAHIKTIAIIDRSVLPKTSRNIIEEGLTGELFGEDKIASQYALDGLIELLQNSGRFTVVRTGKTIQKEGGVNDFPVPMSWGEIEKICTEYKTDAVISLELFDSDYIIPTSVAFVSIGF